jgi:hypothetical protein
VRNCARLQRLCPGLGRLDRDANIEAAAHALGHHAEVLEDLEAAPDAGQVSRRYLRVQRHLDADDAESAALRSLPYREGALRAMRIVLAAHGALTVDEADDDVATRPEHAVRLTQ